VETFYAEMLERLMREGVLSRETRVLVSCGGYMDRRVLAGLGFQNAVISNLDERMDADCFAPFEWSFQDAEGLDFEDDAFDFGIVHAGLHHCFSAHRALLELYRVGRKGILVFEPYDNLVTRLGVRLGFGQDYEHAAVAQNALRNGGVRNSSIPNHVYRWTAGEIVKTIRSYAPHAEPRFEFRHALRIPWRRLRRRRNPVPLWGMVLTFPLLKALGLLFPSQTNEFSALVVKPELPRDLHPWLKLDAGAVAIDPAWVGQHYGGQGSD
jgi:SAM-dependent methyltransferase